MAISQWSFTLQHLLDEAKAIGKKQGMTMERFVYVVLKKLDTELSFMLDTEMQKIVKLLKKKKIDIKKSMEKLAKVANEQEDFVDVLRMQEVLFVAEKSNIKTADGLFAYIMENPSEQLLPCLVISGGLGSVFVSSDKTPSEGQDSSDSMPDIAALDRLLNRVIGEESEEEAEKAEEEKATPEQVKKELEEIIAFTKKVRRNLRENVKGQDFAIDTFIKGYFQARQKEMIGKQKGHPYASFLFAGPPGVGKTLLAKSIAKELDMEFLQVDMSGYSDNEANLMFCGMDSSYKASKVGAVTGFVKDHPKCIILFDEVEKAHLNVIHLFLQMLDFGHVRDNFLKEEISFENVIVIMTTNAGRPLYAGNEDMDFSALSSKVIMRALENDVRPGTMEPLFPMAICSRMATGSVVMFNHLSAHALCEISEKVINENVKALTQSSDIQVDIDPYIYAALMLSEGSNIDARKMSAKAEKFVNNELFELWNLLGSDKAKMKIQDMQRIRVSIQLPKDNETIQSLFVSPTRMKTLMISDSATIDKCKTIVPNLDIVGAQKAEEAIALMEKGNIDIALLDLRFNAKSEDAMLLNVEDISSPSRDFLFESKEKYPKLPVYILQKNDEKLTEEEEMALLMRGCRKVIKTNEEETWEEQLKALVLHIHQQNSMKTLTKERKYLHYETLQRVLPDETSAEICLFDFSLKTAVEAEDRRSVLNVSNASKVKFDDIIGAEDAKKELIFFANCLKNAEKYSEIGVDAPKGLILYGPPGTGKTMLAKAMAYETGMTFIAMEGNQFLKRYVGEGSELVHEVFNTARKYAPAILFIDEIDAIAKERRGVADGGSSAGHENTLTAFLAEMDGFKNNSAEPVFVLAATNFDVHPGSPKSLDEALMRRFDRSIFVDLPNKEERIRFMKKEREKRKAFVVSDDMIENIAIRSTGMSLALLTSVINLSLRTAVQMNMTTVTDEIFEEAFESFNSGEVRKWSRDELLRTARHEAGHALACVLGGEKPAYVTIVARGNYGGYMQREVQEDKGSYTKNELLSRIRTSLAGRAAEIVCYGQEEGLTTGASADLVNATQIAKRIVCTYGMDDTFGLVAVDPERLDASGTGIVHERIGQILSEQMEKTIHLIKENRSRLDELTIALLKFDSLIGTEIERIIKES